MGVIANNLANPRKLATLQSDPSRLTWVFSKLYDRQFMTNARDSSGRSKSSVDSTDADAPVSAEITPLGGTLSDDSLGDTDMASASQAMAARSPSEEPRTARTRPHTNDPMLGTTLMERYVVTEKIGQGGMGAVYEAKHTVIGKRVAVKVLLEKYAERDRIVARLKQEAMLASSIGNEHIIDITDFGETDDGRTFVIMEYLEGESLGSLSARLGQVDEQRAIDIVGQCASALSAAHAKGIVHRDVKPDNVFLLTRKGRDFVKVVDFGISKSLRPDAEAESPRLTQTGMVLGTPLYMSPEQARGDEDLDERIDIYALGVILYELITGTVPFQGSNYLSVISQVISDDPTPPSHLRSGITEELEAVIMKALAKEPKHRYQTMDELAYDLDILRAVDGTTSRGRVSAPRFRKRRRRSGLRILGWIAGVTVIAAAVIVAVAMMGESPPQSQPVAVPSPPDAAPIRVTPPDAAPDAAPAKVYRVRITSKPTGAEVYWGARALEKTTPFVFEWNGSERELTLRKPGYKDALVPLTNADDGKRLPIRMVRGKSGPKRLPRPRTTGTTGAGKRPGATVTGPGGGDLKPNPYRPK